MDNSAVIVGGRIRGINGNRKNIIKKKRELVYRINFEIGY